jgi:hypothetical protein
MDKEFVSYEQALALKELGFNANVLKVYSIRFKELLDKEYANRYGVYYILAPLNQQVFRFFREKYHAHIHPELLMPGVYIIQYGTWRPDITFNTYEEAESACIDKLIELAKQQDK